jgi:hypothetical protein
MLERVVIIDVFLLEAFILRFWDGKSNAPKKTLEEYRGIYIKR